MIKLQQWSIKHHVSLQALKELQELMGMRGNHTMPEAATGTSEAAVASVVRLEAARKGNIKLWRNNVGVLTDANGRPVRYGLANESKALNSARKSGDYIGWRSVLITRAHVGQVIAQFVSRETKRVGWTYKGDDREQAQLAWAQLVVSAGGDACFANGEGTL